MCIVLIILKAVLSVYEKVRLPRANKVLTHSWDAGEIYELVEGTWEKLRVIWEWVWHHDYHEDVEVALGLLAESPLQTGFNMKHFE
jgi:hypothetical protein